MRTRLLNQWRDAFRAWSEEPWLLLLVSLTGMVGVAVASRQSVWYDEAVTAHTVSLPWSQFFVYLSGYDHTPWGYFVLAKLVTSLLGQTPLMLRACSLFAWCGSVWLIRSLAVEFWDDRSTGNFASALLAVSPWALQFAAEARCYAVMMLIALASMRLFLRIFCLSQTSWGNYAGFVCLSFLGLAAHVHYAFVCLAQAVAAWMWQPRLRPGLVYSGLAVSVLAAVFVYPMVIRQSEAQTELQWMASTGWTTPFAVLRMSFRTCSIPLALLIAVAAWRQSARPGKAASMLAACVVITLSTQTLVGHFTPAYYPERQSLFVLPWCILLAAGVLPRWLGRAGSVVCLAVLFAASLLHFMPILTVQAGLSDADLMRDLARMHASPQDVLVAVKEVALPAEYYARQDGVPLRIVAVREVASDTLRQVENLHPARVFSVVANDTDPILRRYLTRAFSSHMHVSYARLRRTNMDGWCFFTDLDVYQHPAMP